VTEGISVDWGFTPRFLIVDEVLRTDRGRWSRFIAVQHQPPVRRCTRCGQQLCKNIEQQKVIANASQNILRAGRQADRWTRIGNQQWQKSL